MKRKNMINAFNIKGKMGKYIVTMEHLKNTVSGNTKFRAVVVRCNSNIDGDWLFNSVYEFTGHNIDEKEEAKWIVERYEKEREEYEG